MDEKIPVTIDRSAGSEVRIDWKDGARTVFGARELRLRCPCAECVDETTGVRVLDPDSVDTEIRVEAARLVGRYAVEFTFTDRHSYGIYTFEALRGMKPVEAP